MEKLISILEQCDIANYNGEYTSWFYDEETNQINFEIVSSGEGFTVKNESFPLVDNTIELHTTSGETIFLDLYVITKPSFK